MNSTIVSGLIALIGFGMLCLIAGVTSPDDVRKYAEMQEWDSYEVTGYRFTGCSKGDWYSTGFVATKDGKRFSGVVCSGLLFKGVTLRLD